MHISSIYSYFNCESNLFRGVLKKNTSYGNVSYDQYSQTVVLNK